MIDGTTRVAGIIGWPVEHSLSPAMHNAAFRALGLNWIYAAFPVHPDRVAAARSRLAPAGCAGLNVAPPHHPSLIHLRRCRRSPLAISRCCPSSSV